MITTGLSGFCFAQSQNIHSIKRPIEIKLDREKLGRVPTIDVMIMGQRRTFFFDSGAAITGISEEVARSVGCEPFGRAVGFDAGGNVVAVKRCDDVGLSIGEFRTVRDTLVLDASAFFPGKPKVDGIISLQTFEDLPITMDLVGDTITIETEKSLAKRIKHMKPLTSRLSRELGGYGLDIFFAANSPKGKIWLLVDTGNTNRILLDEPSAALLGIQFEEPKDKTMKPITIDLAGYGKIEGIGRHRKMIYDGMLNYDSIRKMILTLDLKSGRTWAAPNPLYKEELK